MNGRLFFLSGYLFLAGVWWLVGELKIIDVRLFPKITEVLESLRSLLITKQITINVLSTLYRTLVGFGIAVIFAVPLGMLMGSKQYIRLAINPLVDFFRSLPGTAMFPLFLLVFGIGDASKIAISAFMAFWIILINAYYGVLYSSHIRRMTARVFGANAWQIFRHVIFHEAMPSIITGLRSGLALALIAVVVSEMFIGSSSGLGQKIYEAFLTYEAKDLYAWLIITGIVGFVLSKTFFFIDWKWLHWVSK